MRTAALALCLMGSAAVAQDDNPYDSRLLHSCLGQAQSDQAQSDSARPDIAEDALPGCIGVAAAACMQVPGGDTTVGMVQCLSAEAEDWDKLFNKAYKTAMTAAEAADAGLAQLGSAASPAAPVLRQAQRHWIAFRDASCTYESVRFQGGTAGGPAAADCMMRLTAAQALRLMEMTEAGL